MDEKIKKRRPKGQAALGDVYETKRVVEDMLSAQSEERRLKTDRLRALRLAAGAKATDDKGVV
ncbi:hypothetical protein C8J36_1219 [Rhizobium sp. PP-F2F-G48]|uniref:hypothetical protein n=1 Tax=Rhizobium sp. PP-F2F-G48 TaxID=2135651 RepID=UPI0010488E06|nr:hypothetical protein [Rhizobium sp. PP-F2F-G48]TCM45530.1 hypothetical protein C8J36_1219 [Rhizobium sp. PP-F2F-G48]